MSEKDFGKIETDAKNKVNKYVFISMGVGLIPIPLLDLVALSGIQMKMVFDLSKLYEIPYSKNALKSVIGSLFGGALPVYASAPISSLVKTIPVIGQTTGAVALPVTGGAATYALGKVFIQHFSSGGTFLDFDPEKVREYFAEQLQEGKKVASDIKKNGFKEEPTAS